MAVASPDAVPRPVERDAPAAGQDGDSNLEGGRAGERARRRRRARRLRRVRLVAFTSSLVVLMLAVPVLSFIGFHTVYESRAGKIVHPNLNPAAPGYEAQVEHTPVELVAQIDGAGQLLSLTLMSLSGGDKGGGMLLIPIETTATGDGTGAADTFAQMYASGGLAAIKGPIEQLLNAGIDEAIAIGPDQWTQLVAPVAPIAFDNPDDVEVRATASQPSEHFAAGPLSLTPAQVPEYLAARSVGESDLARLVRQGDFWNAWLAAIASSKNPAVVPGETTTGIGRFVRGLAAGTSRIETLPVEPAPGSDGSTETFTPQTDAIRALADELIQLPISPNIGGRTHVELLDGAQIGAARDTAVHQLIAAGAEIDVIGNASTFGHATTVLTYYDPTSKSLAEALRAALGVGTLKFLRVDGDTIQVSVLLGRDYLAKQGATSG